MSNVRSHLAAPIRVILERVDSVAPRRLLMANLALAVLVLVAHGGALLVARWKASPDAETISRIATFSLPLAAIVALSSVVALLAIRAQVRTLGIHGAIFAVGALVSLVWAAGLLVGGIPHESFSWTTGMLTVIVVYSAFLFSRFSLPNGFRSTAPIFYLPVMALVLAAPIDVGVSLSFAREMSIRFGVVAPNPSIERTPYGGLGPPPAAAHVER